MNTEHVTLNQMVAFAILMESNDGIMGKSPRYIEEKFRFCMQNTNPEDLEAIMDGSNRTIFDAWREKWTPQK